MVKSGEKETMGIKLPPQLDPNNVFSMIIKVSLSPSKSQLIKYKFQERVI